MDESCDLGAAGAEPMDFRAFLRTGPDFIVLDLRRSPAPARVVEFDPATEPGGAAEQVS